MKQTRLLMGMPITVEIVEECHSGEERSDDSRIKGDFDSGRTFADLSSASFARMTKNAIHDVFSYFKQVDEQFSPFKTTSEVAKINRGELKEKAYSKDMKEVLALSEKTKNQTNGYFDVYNNGVLDPSGMVKGWAIQKAAEHLKKKGFENFYINAGGDIQVKGRSAKGEKWVVGIRNPFNRAENVKVVTLSTEGIATSGTAIRGQHIYNPHKLGEELHTIVSITVIAPNILDADRLATAAFAMQEKGIYFLESQEHVEGYMIDTQGIATQTSGFGKYVV